MILLTCPKCGWTHYGMHRKEAVESVDRFNQYYNTLSPTKQQEYYGGKCASIDSYERCFSCGASYKTFERRDNAPEGCTIQPIIFPEE